MILGIVASETEKAKELSKKIEKYLTQRGHEVAGERLAGAEAVFVLGGDGTLIHTACEHIALNVPFIGINVGTLGFLAACEGDEWKSAVDKVIKGDFIVSERMVISAEISKKETFKSLNEITIKGMYRVIDLEIAVNEQKFLDISGDGVIVSTPTGSTAYSLSAGGPIVDPELDSIIVTPISAVGLPIPSVVLSPDDILDIHIKAGDNMFLSIDGQEHVKVSQRQNVKVEKDRYKVKFGYFDKHHFLKALNGKFGLALRAASG